MSTTPETPTTSTPPHLPWYRRIKPWQFSLRTLLVIMAIASGACWYYLLPQRHDEKLADGHLILQREYRGKGVVVRPTTNGANESFEGYNDGYWRLSDFRGRLLVSGNYRKGEEHGWWSTYHVNGRLAVQGKMQNGERVGVWKNWTPEGQLTSEVTYGPAKPPLRRGADPLTVLQGPAKFWHENGKPAAAGKHEQNERSGDWEEWNEQGERTAYGKYSQGKKHGEWQEFDAAEKKFVTREFVHGLRKEVLDEHLRTLTERIEKGDLSQRLTLVSVAAEFGPPALPLLEKFAAGTKNRHELLAAISGIVHCGGKIDPWLAVLKDIEAADDPQLAAAARWEIFRGFPAERAGLLRKSLKDAEEIAESSWLDGFARLREMFVLAPDLRPDIFPVVLKVSPEQTIVTHVHAIPVLSDVEGARMIAAWQVDVVPYLDAALSDPDPKIRMTTVILIRQLLGEQNKPFEFLTAPGGQTSATKWKIPANLQPLVDKARRDTDPPIKERADKLDQPNFEGNVLGGGFGGGGGLF